VTSIGYEQHPQIEDDHHMTDNTHRNGIVAMLGGLLWVCVPAISSAGFERLTAVVAIGAILGVSFGLLELWFRYGPAHTPVSRIGSVLAGLGLAVLLVAAVASGIYAVGNIATTFVLGLLLVTGVLLAAVGSLLLAWFLHDRESITAAGPILLACGLPVDVLLNTLGARLLPVGVSIYGIAWALVGHQLWNGAGSRPSVSPDRTTGEDAGALAGGPNVVRIISASVGLVFAIVGIAGVVTDASGVPFVGRTLSLSAIHLGIGVAGIGAAIGGQRPVRRFNLGAGVLLVLVAAGWAVPPVRAALGLTLVGQVLHLPVGVILLATLAVPAGGSDVSDS
jgi:hypothetical protein